MTLLLLFWEFFKIGLFTIGGGMAMLPLIHKLVVDDKKWLSEEETVDCLAISQAVHVPAADAVELALLMRVGVVDDLLLLLLPKGAA